MCLFYMGFCERSSILLGSASRSAAHRIPSAFSIFCFTEFPGGTVNVRSLIAKAVRQSSGPAIHWSFASPLVAFFRRSAALVYVSLDFFKRNASLLACMPSTIN
jgi:hypothetical protein